jgi:hypothetical protein
MARQETARIKANVRLASRIHEKIMEASLVKVDLASDIAVDFADIAAIGERHKEALDRFLRFQFPRDLGKLERLLVRVQADLLWENNWHLRSLKRGLPKLLDSLFKKLEKQGKSTRR